MGLAAIEETYIRRHTVCAIFVIPVHCTYPVQLLYAKNLSHNKQVYFEKYNSFNLLKDQNTL